MRLSYIQGLGKTATFNVSPGGTFTLKEKSYVDVDVKGTVNVSVNGAGQADFSNSDECCCTREYNASQTYLQRLNNEPK